MAPRLVNEFVLPSLAFEIGLNLRLSGLPNIDHRLALQHGRERRPAVGRLGLTIESVGLRLGLALHVAKPCIEHSEDPTVHIDPKAQYLGRHTGPIQIDELRRRTAGPQPMLRFVDLGLVSAGVHRVGHH